MATNFRILVPFSGGKDSQASLIWATKQAQFKYNTVEAVFCDTGHEHELTYEHIKYVTSTLGVNLHVIRSKIYTDFKGLALAKKRFPSRTRQFCTEELKIKPMIDFILDGSPPNVIVVQGIRAEESAKRREMEPSCTFFKHYFEPYKVDKNGRKHFYSYRKEAVHRFRAMFVDDVIRPVFHWSGQDVVDYSLAHGLKLNPLYSMGAKRVGCFPCINCSLGELKVVSKTLPEILFKVSDLEYAVGKTFFPPQFIPDHACSSRDPKSGKPIVSAHDVRQYLARKDINFDLFDADDSRHAGCVSFYKLCD